MLPGVAYVSTDQELPAIQETDASLPARARMISGLRAGCNAVARVTAQSRSRAVVGHNASAGDGCAFVKRRAVQRR